MNYLVLPFMLLTWRESLLGWSRLGWYGHYMIFGSMAFFYLGGARVLRKMQAGRVKRAGVKANGNGTGVRTSPGTPAVQVPPFDELAKEIEKTEFMRNLSQ